ncbi:NAD(P)/FAD-dependent oxidoreductase [Candidatus Entotheonella palauensis]|uniref:NAD(P)/FAD-dependent oxidoreductase n=1 Tax=Candidatus Entotheonella palauensis TaxID=93172 RepID=UPI0015C4B754|nr:NAD(P)/FAD-dependent oxidoreductase [Candidatus Entotheonella palauensis]
MVDTRFDVIVIGGGPAGSATALTLASQGRKVALVEQAGDTAFRIGEGLPPAAKPLLRDLGVWDAFLAQGHLPSYGNASAWGTSELYDTDFMRDPNGHGWHLDRARFDAMLRCKASAAGAALFSHTRLVGLHPHPNPVWELYLRADTPFSLQCTWLVDATGRRTWVARQLGVQRRREDRLVVFYTRFEPGIPGDTDATTLVEARPCGWWYTALLPNGHRMVMFFTDGGTAVARQARVPEGFRHLLMQTTHVKERLRAFHYAAVAMPRGTAAGSSRLIRFAGERWLTAGDSAMAFDPLSSQGILTALYAGLKAGSALHMALDGQAQAVTNYCGQMEAVYEAYTRQRLAAYHHERRWAWQPFWKARQMWGSGDVR